ncbi:hypothetical protein [Mucilaginibacter gilvus]|uniref:Uncharacterized protein n=1 Tax=Mucilaginibacter gilvus TaxID=2305909 RepID=A0A3S3UQS1_9SPHI|nr:hypothetical protein [Mucilaginibacter gilvus]RWY45998.1 hypothetical protein EPL05_23400 [Mucilaginibacter gilvus]
MKRRDFITKTALTTFLLSELSSFNILASPGSTLKDVDFDKAIMMLLTEDTSAKFKALLKWMQDNGWIDYLNKILSLNINPANADMATYTKNQTFAKAKGFDDFMGEKLIEPGYPAGSLLYHALASPRVRPAIGTCNYPSVEIIDSLEDVIYGLRAFTADERKDMVLAVFAYEYRPAYKTPHHLHADMVFSRTGISRIGDCEMNYDALNRCYTNKPADPAKVKNIAVTPARFGLFLAKKVTGEAGITLMGKAKDGEDGTRTFLQPIRKIFKGDTLLDTKELSFSEYHVNEKLNSLVKTFSDHFNNPIDAAGKHLFDINKPPFRVDSRNSATLVKSIGTGSSVLIKSVPGALVRWAKQNGKQAYYTVKKQDSAYFAAMNTAYVGNEEVLVFDDLDKQVYREVNPYDVPRNTPMFVNAKFKKDGAMPGFIHLERNPRGNYLAALFEDSICDGCVTVDTQNWSSKLLPDHVLHNCLPAFSIITAPDFFPLVDNYDLAGFDFEDNTTNFFEGGLYSFCAERTRPNQTMENPVTKKQAFDTHGDTFTAVFSESKNIKVISGNKYTETSKREYQSSSFLPDVCSGVFAPGWDITYANDTRKADGTYEKVDSYLSTRGLGSPFAEDMKLCAAMNGMWPAASPDAARTYQGSMDTDYRNPTAVPLMDKEIGLHKDSPACKELHLFESTGWDGEQGPFLERVYNNVFVNFTDLACADYIQNAMNGQMDMSVLRNLTSAELRSRMACLKLCIKKLPQTNFDQEIIDDNKQKMVGLTGLWLVSAEKVDDWGKGAKGLGIPADLVGDNINWAIRAHKGISGPGYLYVFANTDKAKPIMADNLSTKRRIQGCLKLYVCQVTETGIAWTMIYGDRLTPAQKLVWNA